jgi:hypothetical protein
MSLLHLCPCLSKDIQGVVSNSFYIALPLREVEKSILHSGFKVLRVQELSALKDFCRGAVSQARQGARIQGISYERNKSMPQFSNLEAAPVGSYFFDTARPAVPFAWWA